MNLQQKIEQCIDTKTKPPGSLGLLEVVALKIALIQQTTTPAIVKPHVVVFAADHGIAATGLVNPYPQSVTAQMVLNFLAGGAAINVFCRQHNIELKVVDAGVAFVFDEGQNHKNFIRKKIAPGTKNYLEGPAMTREEALLALQYGRDVVNEIFSAGCNMIGFGEMGIGNTSSASLLMAAITKHLLDDCIGSGTGSNSVQLETKKQTLQAVWERHQHTLQNSTDAVTLLAAVGGFEIAMMCGAYLQAAENRMVILVDGFISTAALLASHLTNKEVINFCLFAHCSNEKGHSLMLDYLGAQPLLQLGLRLGEGTGAALALPLVQSAVAFLNEMASFTSAGISNKQNT